MRVDRRLAVLLTVVFVASLPAACSDDDPAGPSVPSCGSLTFDDYLPTDENGEITGSGGEGDWCWPVAGSDPSEPYLYPAYPNPFNPATTIRIVLPEPSRILVRVVDARCRLVRTLFDDDRDFGTWDMVWNGLDDSGAKVPDGLYGVILTVGDFDCAGVV